LVINTPQHTAMPQEATCYNRQPTQNRDFFFKSNYYQYSSFSFLFFLFSF